MSLDNYVMYAVVRLRVLGIITLEFFIVKKGNTDGKGITV